MKMRQFPATVMWNAIVSTLVLLVLARPAAPQVPDLPQAPVSDVDRAELVALDISVRGDLATAFARYRARFGDPGEIIEWEGIDSFQLMRHEGRWRIVSLAFLSDE